MNVSRHSTVRKRFTSKLQYRNVELQTAADVVQFSFIIQTPINSLDLELCQSYKINNYPLIRNNRPSLSYARCFVNSEEKWRKLLAPSRNLLYILHLDLPKGRDWSLKNDSQPQNLHYFRRIPHIGKISVGEDFYTHILYKIIEYACNNTFHNVKVLKWFLKVSAAKGFQFREVPDYILTYFVDSMHPEMSDIDFVKLCFTKLHLKNWVDYSEKPGRMENLLFQFHRIGWKVKNNPWIITFMSRCLLHPSYSYVGEVFKFINEPILSKTFILFISAKTTHYSRRSLELTEHLNSSNQKRRILLLHLYWSYLNRWRNLPAISESLRIMWNAVPDALLCSEEITTAFEEGGFSSNEIQDICTFYSDAVGEFHARVQPRSLKHHCRTVIRRRLFECGQWLPEGIQQSGLPLQLQSYLNLQE